MISRTLWSDLWKVNTAFQGYAPVGRGQAGHCSFLLARQGPGPWHKPGKVRHGFLLPLVRPSSWFGGSFSTEVSLLPDIVDKEEFAKHHQLKTHVFETQHWCFFWATNMEIQTNKIWMWDSKRLRVMSNDLLNECHQWTGGIPTALSYGPSWLAW